MFRANATYEGIYLLGTSIARPLIAKRQKTTDQIAEEEAVLDLYKEALGMR